MLISLSSRERSIILFRGKKMVYPVVRNTFMTVPSQSLEGGFVQKLLSGWKNCSITAKVSLFVGGIFLIILVLQLFRPKKDISASSEKPKNSPQDVTPLDNTSLNSVVSPKDVVTSVVIPKDVVPSVVSPKDVVPIVNNVDGDLTGANGDRSSLGGGRNHEIKPKDKTTTAHPDFDPV
jgi:hypothetical protein